MNGSFESLLETALSAPDLALGHEMRRRLLAAASPVVKEASDNIIPFDAPDPDAAAGFDWLAGDAPATRPLIRRMSRDPGFFAMIDEERHFLRSLRRSLRKPATFAPKQKSKVPMTAAAAAMAFAAGLLFAFRDPGSAVSSVVPATAAASGEASASRSPVAAATRHAAAASVPDAPSASVAPFPSRPAAVDSPLVAGLTGDSGVPLNPWIEVSSLAFRLETAAAATFEATEPAVALLDRNLDPPAVLHALQPASWSSVDLLNPRFPSRMDPSFSTGESATSVPEPGGMLSAMIGFLVLLLHRPKRQKSKA